MAAPAQAVTFARDILVFKIDVAPDTPGLVERSMRSPTIRGDQQGYIPLRERPRTIPYDLATALAPASRGR
jgi:hypothetical protein